MSDLKKVGKDISELLGEKLKAEVSLRGSTLIVPETASGRRIAVKDLKMQMKHVLHHLGLSDEYRVLAEHGRLRIVKVEEKPKPVAERKGVAPPPSKSLPYFFP